MPKQASLGKLVDLQPAQSMRLRARAKEVSMISIRLNKHKFDLPVSSLVLASDDNQFVYLSIPSINAILKDGKPITNGERAAALKGLSTRRGRAASAQPQLPNEILEGLKKIPAGFKLAVDPRTGEVRLAKARAKRK